jgi:DNA (cytosine-5)-methyltransferase 1
MTKKWGRSEWHPDLIAPVREALKSLDIPYVIENVEGAPLNNPVMLCGSMFDLRSGKYQLRWHRLFETSFYLPSSMACEHEGLALPVYGHAGGSSKRDELVFPGTAAWREGMGIDWMTGDELAEAIPSAYTEYIGGYLMEVALRRQW